MLMSSLPDPIATPIPTPSLLLFDADVLSRECFAEVLRSHFPSLNVRILDRLDLLASVREKHCRLVILRCDAPSDGIRTALAQSLLHDPETPVVVIGRLGDHQTAMQLINAGARGVLPSSAPLKVTLAALQLVMAGGIYYPLELGSGPFSEIEVSSAQRKPPAPPPMPDEIIEAQDVTRELAGTPPAITETARFTNREWQVLAELQLGRSNKWIAAQLNLSENTIKVHVRQIMRKLRATNRTQAVIYSQTLFKQHNTMPA